MTTKIEIKLEDNKLIIGKDSYAIEKMLLGKIKRIVKGVTQDRPKEDAVLMNEGKEGKGKTNSAIVEAILLKILTRRDVHLFFKLEPLMKFAQSTEKKIIIWDEPSLDSLTSDQITNLNKDMQRLFMTIRKKRHVFLINYTKFWKFPEYMVVDRANGMIHMREDKMGRFIYIRKKKLEFLWRQYRSKHKRAYKKAMAFGGIMPNIMESYFDDFDFFVNDIAHATYDDYESEKDKAISSIGGEKKSKKEIILQAKLDKLRKRIALAIKNKIFPITQVQAARALNTSIKEVSAWGSLTIPLE